MRTRPARADDLARLTAFETDPAAAPYVNTYTPEEHVRMAARDDVTYLAIETEGELDGFVILVLDPDGESVEVRRVVVGGTDRGTGQAALAEVDHYARDVLGRARIWLDVAPFNARAKHVYEKLGYTRFEGTPPPGAEPGLQFYEKRL